MHYVHRLNPVQKRVLILFFAVLPVLFLGLILGFWAYNRGLLTESFELKTVFESAAGLDNQTIVSFSGITIGRVTDIHLNNDDLIEVTMKIEEEYRRRIHEDASAQVTALSLIGQKEVKLEGGSNDQPVVVNGDYIASVEMLEVKNLMEKVRPLIEAGKATLSKLEDIVNSFPNRKMNQAIIDLAQVVENIKEGKASFGKMVSTDKNKLFNRVNALLRKLNKTAKHVKEASATLPETSRDFRSSMKHMTKILENAEDISGNAKTASTALEKLPEMQERLMAILDSLKISVSGLEEMAPLLNKTLKDVSAAAEEFAVSAPQIPEIMDDLELALSESLIVIQSLKSNWPIKNMVPEEKEIPIFEPSQKESPYTE